MQLGAELETVSMNHKVRARALGAAAKLKITLFLFLAQEHYGKTELVGFR